MTSSDYYFRMGSTHSICQDYCLAGDGWAILSDGCSGVPSLEPGSPFSDFGSRFMVRAARKNLEKILDPPHTRNWRHPEFPCEEILADADFMAKAAYLPRSALDATLLMAVQVDEGIKVFQIGDGVVAARHRNSNISYFSPHYTENMPYYLNYIGKYEAEYIANAKVRLAAGLKSSSGKWDSYPLFERSLNLVETYTFESSEYDLIMIMSDGVESFQRKDNGQPIPVEDVLDQLFCIKGYSGEFITRRCNKFLQKFCVDNGWIHYDDFSVAGIYIPEGP